MRLRLARSLSAKGIPREFVTKSRLAIIAKDGPTLNKNVADLQDRGYALPFELGPLGKTPFCGPSSLIQAAGTSCCRTRESSSTCRSPSPASASWQRDDRRGKRHENRGPWPSLPVLFSEISNI